MKQTLKFRFFLISTVLLAACQSASTSTSTLASQKSYVAPEDFSTQTLLPPPPAEASEQSSMDVAKVLQLQSSRSAEDCARARLEVSENLSTFFGPPYGPLTTAEVQAYNDFIEKVWDSSTFAIRKAKSIYPRKRPYQAHEKEVHPCDGVEHTKSNSYPSGHAFESILAAEVLASIDPSRKPIFLLRAAQVAGDRVMTGMHYPSDIEAGAKLGEDFFKALQRSTEFQKDLQSLRAKSSTP